MRLERERERERDAAYGTWVDGPCVEHTGIRLHTQHSRLGYSILVVLDGRVNLVEVRVSGILPSRDADGDKPPLIQVVTQNMSHIRETLHVMRVLYLAL